MSGEAQAGLSDGLQIPPLPRISAQAFCETPDVARVMEAAAQDRRMSKAHFKINMGGVPAAIETFRSSTTPNLMILESLADRMTLIDQLEALANYCDAGTKVVIVGHENDISLYRDLTARGISDYILAPIDTLGFIQQIALLYHAPGSDVLGRLIAVIGAKGGVGASTLAHNIGWSISKGLGLHTILADLDLPFGTLALDFNQDPAQGISEAVFSPNRLDANMLDRLLWKCGEKLSLLAAPATIERTYDIAEGAFDTLVDLLRASAPCAVLDAPHQWSAWTRRVLTASDEVLVVATPDLASLRNVKAIIDTLVAARPNDQPPRFLLNMVGVPKRPEIAVEEFAKAIGKKPAAVIPFDANLFGSAANNGQMLAEVDAGSKIVATLDELCRELLGKTSPRRRRGALAPLLERLGLKAG